ncbi:ATP-dependent DNA helicase DinG [Kushneria phosphatilytica]|uniref:ATP-dependent DNA helicase DinG n=1 Tax=Kushneria phosphatilytica TaxID=657387 RepID=A0A1S1NY94_9GAMM|nr:ATP-dependent DNA helicase DinG [Kushneria phosphatilytica]OHV11823.1 ATP-dependent DNA helicase DinG [Kushneria phosphatilytica]QEL10989.1 ATP-dependent DNA helicase DinG [Kushneria phosphatilytica]
MLDTALKDEIQEAYRKVLEALELRPRYGQRLMIAEIARTLGGIERDDSGQRTSDEHVCVLEAGTGTGKTLAYLLAALPVARAHGKRLVVSTATVALQEQVLHQDLPMVRKHSGLTFDYALAKGRGRYMCLSKLEQVLDGAETNPTLSMFEQQLQSDSEALGELAHEMADAYASGEWAGDRDSWHGSIDEGHWRSLTTDHRQCTNRRCGHFGACAFFRARRRLDEADVIVANHDLVLSDLSLGGGMVLPPPKDCIYIFDEGHHLPDKALEHFYHRLGVNAALRWLGQLKKSLNELTTGLSSQPTVARLLGEFPELIATLESKLGEAARLAQQYADGLPASEQESIHHRFPLGVVPEALLSVAEQLVTPFAELSRHLESISNILRESLDPEKTTGLDREQAEQWLPLVALLHGRSLEASELWTAFTSDERSDNDPPQARWLSFQQRGPQEGEIMFSASPVSAAQTLARYLWGSCYGAVLTSATLTALGRFDRIQERAGLANRYRYQALPSPFDYSRARLSVPLAAVDPADRERHERAIIDFVAEQAADEAALVLFSSRRQLRAVAEALPEAVGARVLSQDRLPRHELLKQHRTRVDAGQGSIIFGLASFAEGIDLPGEYLTHVIITRLPFSVPDDPVGATLAEWIESRGGNPFMRISVPDASIRLVQACGRLIRKEIDSGRITLLDRRVLTRRYGKALLDSLPPFERDIEIASKSVSA